MLGATMLRVVGQQCCVRLHGLLQKTKIDNYLIIKRLNVFKGASD